MCVGGGEALNEYSIGGQQLSQDSSHLYVWLQAVKQLQQQQQRLDNKNKPQAGIYAGSCIGLFL